MNFSTNQVRQFYVVHGNPVVTHEGTGLKQIVGSKYDVSDLIDPKKITDVVFTSSEMLSYPETGCNLSLKDGITPEVGKTYTFKIYMYDLYGAGDEYTHPLVASAEAKTTEVFDLYAELVKSLNAKKYVENIEDKEASTDIPNYFLYADASENGIDIYPDREALLNGWTRGINPLKEIKFEVSVDTEVWAKPEYFINPFGISGIKLADLEYFCMGERGDQYRMMGYPNHIPTEYKIDPMMSYNVIDIMYYHSDNKEGVQRSEKVITLAIPTDVEGENFNVSNAIINSLKQQ